MSVTLYFFHGSLCSQKVRLALEEKNVSYTGRLVNIGPRMENYEPWYMRINPRGVVPTLDHDGHIVTDSARIVVFVDEHFDGPDLQRFFIDPNVELAPDAPFRAAMLACVPLAFTFDLDPGAVDQQVQRPLGAAVGDVHGQGLLAAR